MNKQICVIGGGASGIGMGKCLTEAGFDFDIVEREDDFGGNWYKSSKSSRVYKSAHLISSKTNTQFSDFPMPHDYPDYPNHELFLQYLRSVAAHYNLYQQTTFNVSVEKLYPLDDGWTVTLSDQQTRWYPNIIVANGLLREPKLPSYSGNFTGEIIHSSKYQDPSIFQGKRVLIVGAGNSGCDLVVDAALNADLTVHSTRRGYHYMPKFIAGQPTQDWLMEISSQFDSSEAYWSHVKNIFKMAGFDGVDYGLRKPDHEMSEAHPIMNSRILYHIGHGDILPKPDLQCIDNQKVTFIDGTELEFDLIVYATGYRVSLPFIDEKLIDWKNGLSHLFMNAIPLNYDNIAFIGYFNIPSGYGNLANAGGRFLSAYFQAKERKTKSWHIFNRLKQHMNEIDIGKEQFVNTERHIHELDLWKYIKTANFLRNKLELGIEMKV